MSHDLIKRARDLVERKGEMSIELWNDKAQCLLAPIAHELEKLSAEVVEAAKANLRMFEQAGKFRDQRDAYFRILNKHDLLPEWAFEDDD